MPDLGKAYVQIVPSADGISGSIQNIMDPEAEKAGKSSGSKFGGALKSSIGGIAKVGAAATAALAGASAAVIAAAGKTAEYGDNIDKTSQKLGVSSTFYQEWDAVLQHSGTSMDAMGGTFKTLANAAQDASKDQQEAFKALGMSMEEVSSLSSEDLFKSVIGNLQGMEEGTERTALATKLLGRGAQELGPLLNTSAEETQGMIDAVNELGGVMSADQIKASAQYQDAMQDAQTALKSFGTGIMMDLLPYLTKFLQFATEKMPVIKEAISGAVTVVSAIVTRIRDFIMEHMGEIQSFISTASAVISTVVQTIANAFKYVVAQVTTDGTTMNTIFNNIKTIVQSAVKIVINIFKTLIALWNGPFGAALRTIGSLVASVFGAIVVKITGAYAKIYSTIANLGSTFTRVFNTIKSTVMSVVNAITGAFNSMHFSWPHIPMPHFSISPPGWSVSDLVKGKIPSLGISWYAKGGMFDSASLIGVGEAGPEAIVPLDPFWERIDDMVATVTGGGQGGTVNLSINLDGSTIAKSTIKYINGQTVRYNTSPLML